MHQEDGQNFGREQWRKGIPSKWNSKSKCEKVRKCGIILEKKICWQVSKDLGRNKFKITSVAKEKTKYWGHHISMEAIRRGPQDYGVMWLESSFLNFSKGPNVLKGFCGRNCPAGLMLFP